MTDKVYLKCYPFGKNPFTLQNSLEIEEAKTFANQMLKDDLNLQHIDLIKIEETVIQKIGRNDLE